MRANYSPPRRSVVGSNFTVLSLWLCVSAKPKLPVDKKMLEKLPVRYKNQWHLYGRGKGSRKWQNSCSALGKE